MEKKPVLTQEDIMNLLDQIYQKCLDGIPKVSLPIERFADDYLRKEPNPRRAAKTMMNYQVAKCTTSGVITGFGGAITLPVTIPANISSVLYVQMRMIACTAYMAGYDVHSDQVQTVIYACLAGVSINSLVKRMGVTLGQKTFTAMVKKIPGKVLTKINQKVGFCFLTKFGEKGLINIGKLVPGVGAVISGGIDFAETRIIANRAYKMFILGDFSDNDSKNEDEITDADIVDVDFTE